MEKLEFQIIGHVESDFPDKFGIPRQSGLAEHLMARIVLEEEFRVPEALRGLESYSHLWIVWYFSETDRKGEWSPTVRPPRLGGNKRVGVFATRSPFRPNPIGLSSVKIEKIENDPKSGPVIYVSGADLMDGTPILDIKPYLAYVDAHPEAAEGFALNKKDGVLKVQIVPELLALVPEEKQQALLEVLGQDPRPQYQTTEDRIYKMCFAEHEVWFSVKEDTLYVVKILENR